MPHVDTDTDEDSTADNISNSPLTNSRLFDEGLQRVHRDITRQLATVERDGEQIKQVVGYAIVGSHADSPTTQDLHHQLAELLSEIHDSHDSVTLDDIALALWAELTRVSEMALPDDENDENKDEMTTDPDSEVNASEEPDDEGLRELFGSSDTKDTDNKNDASDPAFQ